jgi:hypothetical protein
MAEVKVDLSRLKNRKAVFMMSLDFAGNSGSGQAMAYLLNESISMMRRVASGKISQSELSSNMIHRRITGEYSFVIDSAASSGELVDIFYPIGGFSLEREFFVKKVLLVSSGFDYPARLRADVAILPMFNPALLVEGYSFNRLAIMANVDFLEVLCDNDGWTIAGVHVSKSFVKEQLSIICYYESDTITVHLSPNTARPSNAVLGINISVEVDPEAFPLSSNVQGAKKLASPKLVVEFDTSWDSVVENEPVIILEADTIEISNSPDHIDLKKSTIAERPVEGGGNPPAGDPGGGNPPEGGPGSPNSEPDGLGIGAIIGIVVGAIVVVGVIGFCVYWFAIRPGSQKGQVGNAN